MPPFQSGQILSGQVLSDQLLFSTSPSNPHAAPQRALAAVEQNPHRYQLQHLLGDRKTQFETAQTWLAIDLDTPGGDRVVLKLMPFDDGAGWQRLKLFEREMLTMQRLAHPHLPTYRNRFSLKLDDSHWLGFAQEYIAGKSLKALAAERHHFGEAQLQHIAAEVLNILTYLHQQQPPVLHRDIKPSNLLLVADPVADPGVSTEPVDTEQDEAQAGRGTTTAGHPQLGEHIFLIDLGAVQVQPSAPGDSFTVVGTYGYAPMEQFGGRAVPASDLYALGTSLIHLLTGVAPADALENPEQWSDVSPAFRQWLQTMTHPEVGQRYRSAAEALNALGQIPQQAGILAAMTVAESVNSPTFPPLSSQAIATADELPPLQARFSPLIARSYPSPRQTRPQQTHRSPARSRSFGAGRSQLPQRQSTTAPPEQLHSGQNPSQKHPQEHRIPLLGGPTTALQGPDAINPNSITPNGITPSSINAPVPYLGPTTRQQLAIKPIQRPSGSQIRLERSPNHLLLELPGNDLGHVVAGFGGVLLLISGFISPLLLPLALGSTGLGLWLAAPHWLRLERPFRNADQLGGEGEITDGSKANGRDIYAGETDPYAPETAGTASSIRLSLWRSIFGQALQRKQERHTHITHLFHTLRTHDQRPDVHQPNRNFVIQTPRREYAIRTTLTPAESAWLLHELRVWLEQS